MNRVAKVFFAVIFSVVSINQGSVAYGQSQGASQASPSAWQKVAERDKVCMVTDMVFNRPQIPVQVGGKTYYGCCHNCKDRLANDISVRFGTDPVNRKKVDKATAVIAAGADGSVRYFENEGTLKTFLSTSKK